MTARGFVYRHVVTLDETNVVGNVYFAHYLHWQGHCREHFLRQHAPTTASAVLTGSLALVTVSCSMDYFGECRAFEELHVVMALKESSGNRITMDFEFRREDQMVSRGAQTVACMRRSADGLIPTPVPTDLRHALDQFT